MSHYTLNRIVVGTVGAVGAGLKPALTKSARAGDDLIVGRVNGADLAEVEGGAIDE